MRIDFDEKEHIYALNGNIANISITELLRKHGLSPDYSGVSATVLSTARERGKAIHKEIENYINEKTEPTFDEAKDFVEWANKNLIGAIAEQKLGYDYKGLLICGTADMFAISTKKEDIIADYKCMATIHKESVSWQVSLLDYIAKRLDGEKINGRTWRWKGSQRFYCVQLYEGKMKLVELEPIPDCEIEKLLECEFKGEIYQRPQLIVESDLQEKFLMAEQAVIETKKVLEIAEQKAQEYREQIKRLFEEQNIRSWESDKVKVSYVLPADRASLDTTKVKREYPQVFESCQKLSKVKPYIKITIKENEEND